MNGLCEQCQLFFPVPDDFGQGVPYLCPQCQSTLVPFDEDQPSTNDTTASAEPPDAALSDEAGSNGKIANVLWFFPQPSPEVEAARARRHSQAAPGGADVGIESSGSLAESLFDGVHYEETRPDAPSRTQPMEQAEEDGAAMSPPWASTDGSAATEEGGSEELRGEKALVGGRFESNYSMKGAGSGQATKEELPIGFFPGARRPPPTPEEELPELDLTQDEDLPVTKDIGPVRKPPKRRKPFIAAASGLLLLGVGGFWVYSGGLDAIYPLQDYVTLKGDPGRQPDRASGKEDDSAAEPGFEAEEMGAGLDGERAEADDTEEAPVASTEPSEEAEPAVGTESDAAPTEQLSAAATAPPADSAEPARRVDRRQVTKTKTGPRRPARDRVVKRPPPDPQPAPEVAEEPPPPEEPPTKAPVTKAPVTKAPVAKAPVTKAPVTQAAPAKAPSEEPEQPSAAEQAREHLRAGSRLLQQGQAEGAIAEFEKAVALDERNAQAHRGLGIAHASLGRGADAARHYEIYLRLRPNARDAAQVQQIIDAYHASQQ